MNPFNDPPIPRRRRPPGRRYFRIAWLLGALTLLVALAFPFVWQAISGQQASGWVGKVTSAFTSTAPPTAGATNWNGTPWVPATSNQVAWPPGDSVLARWNARTPGQGTVFGWFWRQGSPQGYVWSEGIAQPIPQALGGDPRIVLIVEWPRGEDPASPTQMHMVIGALSRQPNGDIMPQALGWGGGCFLNAEQAAWVAANGVPDELVRAMAADPSITSILATPGPINSMTVAANPGNSAAIDPARFIPPPPRVSPPSDDEP